MTQKNSIVNHDAYLNNYMLSNKKEIAVFTVPELGHIPLILKLLNKLGSVYRFICYTYDPDIMMLTNLSATNAKLQEAGCDLRHYENHVFSSYHNFNIREFISHYSKELSEGNSSLLLVDRYRLFHDLKGSPIVIGKMLDINVGVIIPDIVYHDDQTECFPIEDEYKSLFYTNSKSKINFSIIDNKYCLKDLNIKLQSVINGFNVHSRHERYFYSWYQSSALSNKKLEHTYYKNDNLIYFSFGSYMTSCVTIGYVINNLADNYNFIVSSSNNIEVQSCIKDAILPKYQDKIKNNDINIQLFTHVEEMNDAHFVISACGANTLIEAILRIKPIICMPLGEEQKFNAKQVEELGIGLYIYDYYKDPTVNDFNIILNDKGQNEDFDLILNKSVDSIKNDYNYFTNNIEKLIKESDEIPFELGYSSEDYIYDIFEEYTSVNTFNVDEHLCYQSSNDYIIDLKNLCPVI